MAKLVLGMGTSHGPLLSTPPDQWDQRVEADRRNPDHPFRGGTYGFDDLVRMRAGERIESQITPDEKRSRSDRCRRALDRMAETFADIAPDVAVIVGNDQREIFGDDNTPAICIYWGEQVENIPATDRQKAMMPPGIAIAEPGHRPPERATYACYPDLGLHLIRSLVAEEFDVAQSSELPDGGNAWSSGIPHAFGFVYRQIMKDDVIPHVPVILNTFYPPNQPSAQRCFRLGQALKRAIEAWNEDATVALIASGGLSHFVIDEELDRSILAAMGEGDEERLAGIPEHFFRSGTSEIKNWLPVAAAMMDAGRTMEVVDYVPCYRSEAGTGNAMGFVCWT